MNTLFADNNLFRRVGSITLARKSCESMTEYEASNKEKLSLMVKYIKFDRIILSSSLAKKNLTSIVKKIKKRQKQAKILIINEFKNDIMLHSGVSDVIDGYISVNEPLPTYEVGLKSFLLSGEYSKETTTQLETNDIAQETVRLINPFDQLSANEYNVVMHLVNGDRVSHIALLFQISISAVSTYKSRAFKKLGVENISQLKNLHETIFCFKDKIS
ncbi:LuxR C-terminal-related transcriptional regulator [Sphingobacterium chungjuense]|uniref:LuxR C-terminal-related transcriptional regulator n=1 Tax=Sphingobacterium chungjuense TaxID=2675553 RepID=UPI00140B5201|nr:LuxR C-terminal-related transcriptional regulator [Sphingobacterium chungjuense]